MNQQLAPIAIEELVPPLWEIGWARGIERTTLRAHLGQPLYVETDTHRTFGGEEDWWAYRTPAGSIIAICLRVPYQDAVVCSSEQSSASRAENANALLQPWPVELFEEPWLR